MNKTEVTVLSAIIAATVIGAAIFVADGIEKQPVYAPPTTCTACAKNFAPGQEAEDPTGAEDFSPGHVDETNPILEPKDDAPGQFDKKPIPE
jgi:hypothetical protein